MPLNLLLANIKSNAMNEMVIAIEKVIEEQSNHLADVLTKSAANIAEHKIEAENKLNKLRQEELEKSQIADCMLNHTIKGCCGTAISFLETFIELQDLDKPVQNIEFVSNTINQLRQAITYFHNRQVFLDLMHNSYQSVKIECNLESIFEKLVSNQIIVHYDLIISKNILIDEIIF